MVTRCVVLFTFYLWSDYYYYFTWQLITGLKPKSLQYKSYTRAMVWCIDCGFFFLCVLTEWPFDKWVPERVVLSCCCCISHIPMSSLHCSYLSSHILAFSGQWSVILEHRCYFWGGSAVKCLYSCLEGCELSSYRVLMQSESHGGSIQNYN